ncbi:ATP-binding protein [Rubricoccus marinus]|uniref:Histidine kinase/HSP90-like ATPase domain-containing protein n=1 Tax=Rubricoccus marinus TaxID=716817 RepID=A0A259TZQ5_9BACT|nr:ATP-binding protein [Rubricoccus marinus]OZC03263.1 hypothetical protein BSZ36_09905 [Rubricoccus marinus]
MSTHRFTDLTTVIDDLHALFDAWSDGGMLRPPLNKDGEIVLRLAVHEWVANLVQHASFHVGVPEICVSIEIRPEVVEVCIEDTSQGFDLLGQLEEQHELLNAPAPSERGRGLLMLITCTETLDYRPATEGRQRLSFELYNPDEAIFAGLFHSDAASGAPSLPASLQSRGDGAASGDELSSFPQPFQPHTR